MAINKYEPSVSSSGSCAQAEEVEPPTPEEVLGIMSDMEGTAYRDFNLAANKAAHEAKQMGYDPEAAMQALPNLLSAAERMLDAVKSKDPAEPEAQRPDGGAIKSLKGALLIAQGEA